MLLVIADAHEYQDSPNSGEFMKMLDAIEKSPCDVVFLGDIMDLWIAIPRYEDEFHVYFRKWCERQRGQGRKLFFVEGNHEFFVARNCSGAFTESSEKTLKIGDILFAHGHFSTEKRFNFNKLFIGLSKSWLGLFVLKFMPWGQAFANKVKAMMGSRYTQAQSRVPEEDVSAWAAQNAEDAASVILGHFHVQARMPIDEKSCCIVLPAWKYKGEIALIENENVRIGKWSDLIGK